MLSTYYENTNGCLYFRNQMKNQHCQSRLILYENFSVRCLFSLLVFSRLRNVDVLVQDRPRGLGSFEGSRIVQGVQDRPRKIRERRHFEDGFVILTFFLNWF